MEIIYSPKFAREYKKLPKAIKFIAEEKESIFRKNPFNKILETHKLHGRLKDFWSFSINKKYRIIFEYGRDGKIYFLLVGQHNVYQ